MGRRFAAGGGGFAAEVAATRPKWLVSGMKERGLLAAELGAEGAEAVEEEGHVGVGPDGARGPLAAVHAAAEVEEVFAGGGLVVVLRVAEEPGLLAGDEPLDGERARGALGEEEDVRAGGRPSRRARAFRGC